VLSLRREWTRAFAIMLVLLVVGGAATFGGVELIVGQFGGTSRQLAREVTVTDALRTDMIADQSNVDIMVSGFQVNRPAAVQDQADLSRTFVAALAIFPLSGPSRALLGEARAKWQALDLSLGLWGDEILTFHSAGLGALSSPATLAKLEGLVSAGLAARAPIEALQGPSLAAMDRGLASADTLQRALGVALAGALVTAIGGMLYFRRRMAKDLLRPVAIMHAGVGRLEAGQLDHRIEVVRPDELGELAEAFNRMADALDDSHRTLTERATHDSLTGLANRAVLADRLTSSFAEGSDRRARHDSVLFIDVDDFKDVNDTLGHDAGDQLLIQLADRLEECVRPSDLVARLGGDEFAILVAEDDGGSTATDIAQRVLAALQTPFSAGGVEMTVAVSIGVARRRPETIDAAELLRQADFAMYMAKGAGKGRFASFDAQMHDDMLGRSALKTDLGVAVAQDQLGLDYQPVVDLNNSQVVGIEALVRWQHPTLGLLPPVEFIPLAEETGAIDAIGCWVLDTAARQAAQWRHSMANHRDLWVSVNLSALQLRLPRNLEAIQHVLCDPATEAHHVVLEVTETALAVDIDDAIASLQSLKQLGVRIAIDDFGTGYSSLSTLARLPVDILKIDRAFVSGPASTAGPAPMLEAIMGLASKLDLTVIAEGIEQPDQLHLLRDLGCPWGQGFLLGRPIAVDALEPRLASGRAHDVDLLTSLPRR
jgi:diguanylate cyclase (GGDEF)-like protein